MRTKVTTTRKAVSSYVENGEEVSVRFGTGDIEGMLSADDFHVGPIA